MRLHRRSLEDFLSPPFAAPTHSPTPPYLSGPRRNAPSRTLQPRVSPDWAPEIRRWEGTADGTLA